MIKKYNKPVIFASSQMSELNHSSYGMLKLLGEKMTRDIGGVSARFWNVFGYEPDGEKSHVITDFIKMQLFKKGGAIAILDLAELIQKISGCKIKVGTKKDQTQQNAMNEPNLRMNQWWQPNYSLFEGIRELWNISKE